MRTKGAKGKFPTKNLILLEAFKLFASKQYDQVTFDEIEKATNLTRGAILYHIKNKETLFAEVIETFVFSKMSVAQIYQEEMSLERLISRFILLCREEKKRMKENGITNINLALLNIENSAFSFYPDMKDQSIRWYNNEHETWQNAIRNAIEAKEIKEDTDVEFIAKLFEHVYLGVSYAGTIEARGFSPDTLKKEFLYIYQTIKL